MMDSMEPLRTDQKLKELYICDVGLNKKNESDFVELLTQLRKRSVKVVYIDCLLYTSPSPRGATLSRMPSSA